MPRSATQLGREPDRYRWTPSIVSPISLSCDLSPAIATGTARVVCGDVRNITAVFAELRGRVALVLTSPPYGSHTHGQVRTRRDNNIRLDRLRVADVDRMFEAIDELNELVVQARES
ncbi:UNVERIFIED_ORG: hypothetical protein CLV66_1311, partial [Actinomadura viridilutea]